MNEWLKKVFGGLKDKWSKWKPIQKVILIGIVVVVIVAIVVTASVSGKDTSIRLFNSQITDSTTLTKIVTRCEQEGVDAQPRDGYIYVPDAASKRKMQIILNDENLLPDTVDIWSDYFERSWSTTDADQNVKLGIKKQQELENFLKNYNDIADATVTIELPPSKLLSSEQDPVKCGVILRTKSGSNLLQDRSRIKGIERAILAGVEGLKKEYLIITDVDGRQVNDDLDMAEFDRLSMIEKGERIKVKREVEIRAKILKAFQNTYGEDRCRDMLVSVSMDLSQKQSNKTEITPIVRVKDNPNTPYDETETVDYLPVSSSTVTKEWQGQAISPEGPPGVEGQTSPVYADNSNTIGRSTETGVVQNNVFNKTETQEVTTPQIDKVTVSVNIDGKWTEPRINKETGKYEIDDYGWRIRDYIPLTPDAIKAAEDNIKGAIGYDQLRGDLVYVTNTPYDRDDEFHKADLDWKAKEQRKTTIILVLVAVLVVLIGFILFRVISKIVEKKRREREARLLAEQQAARERQLWDAKEEGMEVTMSVEET
ncbi:MAG: flagellar M-ring protein FliF, partial [Treponema sp.]|nr:flagellar M-ring protein FliF [Treponema sp.]